MKSLKRVVGAAAMLAVATLGFTPTVDAAEPTVACGELWCVSHAELENGCHVYFAGHVETGERLMRIICGKGATQIDSGWETM